MSTEPAAVAGKVVAITGGARGIGRATAEAFIRQGAKVALGDLDLAEAQRTADQLGAGTIAVSLDVTDRGSFAAFIDETEQQLGPLDVLVNNAGIMPVGRFEDEDDASTIRQVDINIHGVITGTKLAIRRMRPRGRGHVVNIASVAGLAPGPGVATYVATKHAVVGLTESVRYEMKGTGVELTAICPAPVATELFSGLETGGVLKPIQPTQVADAIVDAVRNPRPRIVVPKQLSSVIKTTSLLPTRAQEGVAKLLKTDQGLLPYVRPELRAAYEARAAASEPSVPSAERPTLSA